MYGQYACLKVYRFMARFRIRVVAWTIVLVRAWIVTRVKAVSVRVRVRVRVKAVSVRVRVRVRDRVKAVSALVSRCLFSSIVSSS